MIVKPICYLSGPIANCSDEQCVNWRVYCKDNYSHRFDFLDPMRRDYRHLANLDVPSSFEEQKKIVTLDKIDIERSNALLVWTGEPFPSVGTSMEVMYGFDRGKLIIVVFPYKDRYCSPWLYYHAHKIVQTIDEGMDAIWEKLA